MNEHLHCDEFNAGLASYLADTMHEADAVAMERHGSACVACGEQLERATRIPFVAVPPTPPPAVRVATLHAIASMHASKHASKSASRARAHRTRLIAGALAVAAAVLLFVRVRPLDTPPRYVVETDTLASASASPTTSLRATTSLAVSSIAAANAAARPEFAALDDAANELQRLLNERPGDGQLRSFLAIVNARRAELTHRVQDAGL